jgi:TonB-dependent starch-binding outer membrane protein SusC
MKIKTGTKINFRLFLLSFLFCSATALFAQQGTIKGKITDGKGEPIIGANIFIEGTTTGTISDIDGNYTLEKVPAGEVKISASFVGFLKETSNVTVVADQTAVVAFVLVEDLQQLSEVVVIGYGAVKKSDLTGAVSSVKSEELTKLATTSVQQAMQGRVAGVMVTSNSGAPGDDVSVRIRGISTANNSDPLYVVDGFPSTSISYLNPSDIESMEILKDASATAIYGNRGATGVILITTKKGKNEKAIISFNTYFGTLNANKTIPLLNAAEYAEAKYVAYDNYAEIRNRPKSKIRGSGSDLDTTFQGIIDRNFIGTDWQNEVLRTGSVQNYELGANGGSDKYTYNLSGAYTKEDGIVMNSGQKKYTLRMSGTSNINKYIKTDMSMSYRHFERSNYDVDIYGQGILPNALVGDPISPVYRPDTDYYAAVYYSGTWNPVAAADRMINNRNYVDQLVGNVGVDITIFKGLVFSSKFGGDLNWNRTKRYIPEYNIGNKDAQAHSSLDEIFLRTFSWNNSNYLNFNKDFGKHTLNLMIGQEWSAFDSYRLRYTVYDVPNQPALFFPHLSVPDPNDPQTSSFNPDQQTVRPAYQTSLSSYFGRVFYSYDSKYLLTVNMRRDASSQLAKDSRWGDFPSYSLGWNIKNENFLKNITEISALKLRYGWGKTGNIGSLYDPYSLYGVVSSGWDYAGQNDIDLIGNIQTTNPNTKMEWEEVIQSNYAVDFGFLNNKLTGTIDYFKKKTSGMIILISPPYFSGSLASQGNYGVMESQGTEITLDYRDNDHEFKYEVSGNITFLGHPKVTQWDQVPYKTGSVTKIKNVTITEKDAELGAFWGYKTDGLLTQADIDANPTLYDQWYFYPGQVKLLDLNGDSTFSDLDKTNIGSPNPDYFYGLNFNFSYKGFDMLLFFQGVYGNELINGMNAWSKFPDEGDNNLNSEVLNAWTPDNQNTTVPRLVQGNPIMQQNFNDYIVEDASYFRLKNIQFGYTIPVKLISKIGMSNFRIYISGENLFTKTKYSGYDPEVGASQFNSNLGRTDPLASGIDQANYPIARKVLFGLNISF